MEWEPEISYSDPSTTYTLRDYLTKDDRRKMREAAMSYGSVPPLQLRDPRGTGEMENIPLTTLAETEGGSHNEGLGESQLLQIHLNDSRCLGCGSTSYRNQTLECSLGRHPERRTTDTPRRIQ